MKYILSDIRFFKIEIKQFLQLTNFESGVSPFAARKYTLFQLNSPKTNLYNQITY